MRISAFVTILGLVAGTAAPLYGQSLADVAKKEEDRRKTVKEGKAYTNKDLKPTLPPAAAPAPASPSTAGTGADAKPPEQKAEEKTPAKGETKDRPYWFGRMQGLRQQLERDQSYAEALQSRINALTADFAARDDPAQRAQIGATRQKAIAELDRLKIEIDEGTKAIAALEEEARRAGVPPGWLR